MSVMLHCDLNNFYASVECMLNPSLRDIPVAVCGSAKNRHGIVLAKNQIAKNHGVKTGETIWQAMQKSPKLVVVSPHYKEYYIYSGLVSDIYKQYTDLVEPFGIDECWLDITGSTLLFGSGEEIAHRIRKEVKAKYGITISVGVSYNKIFAKMGSDLKKPDAVSVITRENFKEKLWHLPACDMMGVGRSTYNRFKSVGIYTIGDIAQCNPQYMEKHFGKNGFKLWQWCNGYDNTAVAHQDFISEAKSVGNSTTCVKDLSTIEEANQVILALSEKVASRLRKDNLLCGGISLYVKDPHFCVQEQTDKFLSPTCDTHIISNSAIALLLKHWKWENNIRALGVRAIHIYNSDSGKQLNFFVDHSKEDKRRKLEDSIDNIRDKFGKSSIKRGSLMLPSLMPKFNTTEDIHMPNFTGK